jgi:hypothetical protein
MRRLGSAPRWSSFLVVVLAVAFASPDSVSVGSSEQPSPTWQKIAKAPIAGRIGAGTVWTGNEMLAWGGVVRAGSIEAVGDGAAYDPLDGSWRSIRSSPHGVLGGGGQAAVWTGRRALFWAGNSPDGPAGGAVYNPRTGRWRNLSRGPLGPREGYASAWTGSELIIVGGTLGDGLARPIAAGVNPSTDRWHRLPGFGYLEGLRPSGAIWSGDRLFVGGLAYDCSQPGPCTIRPIFLSYDLATDLVEEIDLAPALAASFTPVGWTGTEVFGSGDDRTSVLFYDPATDQWRSGGPAPCDAGERQVAFLGDRYVAACGRDALQIYSLASDTWEIVQAGRSPLNSREGSAIAWTGSGLIVWSGVAPRTGNPTPNGGKRITLIA